MNWLLAPYGDGRTYLILGYLLSSLPLALAGFVLVVTGLSLGLGLMITLLGVPVLVVTLLGARHLAAIERGRAGALLCARLPRPRRRAPQPGGIWVSFVNLLTDRTTWSAVVFLLLWLPLSILDLTVALVIVGLVAGGFAHVVLVAIGEPNELGGWIIDTGPEALILVAVSGAFILFAPRLLEAWATVPRTVVTALLGRLDAGALKREVAEVLASTGESDAYRILDELELRLGRGPFLTPTHVQAALLALSSDGRLRARHLGFRVLYEVPPARPGRVRSRLRCGGHVLPRERCEVALRVS